MVRGQLATYLPYAQAGRKNYGFRLSCRQPRLAADGRRLPNRAGIACEAPRLTAPSLRLYSTPFRPARCAHRRRTVPGDTIGQPAPPVNQVAAFCSGVWCARCYANDEKHARGAGAGWPRMAHYLPASPLLHRHAANMAFGSGGLAVALPQHHSLFSAYMYQRAGSVSGATYCLRYLTVRQNSGPCLTRCAHLPLNTPQPPLLCRPWPLSSSDNGRGRLPPRCAAR